MRQKDVFDWKANISAKYKPLSKDIDGYRVNLQDIQWLKFGWVQDTDLKTGRRKLFYHLDKVWVHYGFSKDGPWKKIKIVCNTRLSSCIPDHLYNG